MCVCVVIAGCGAAKDYSNESSLQMDGTVVYDCQGEVVHADFSTHTEQPQTVQLFFVNRKHVPIILPSVTAASGVKYANDEITFWTQQGEALLSLTGQEDAVTCTEAHNEQESDQVIDLYGNFVPKGCKQWFDGCNTCKVSKEGELSCTRKTCAPDTVTPGRCIEAR